MSSCLLLNFSYEPLGVVSLQRAVRLLYSHKAEVLHEKDQEIHSEKLSFRVPSVLRLLYYVTHRRKSVPLTKKNVLLRDKYVCGYCSCEITSAHATVDHVVPRSQGGQSTWENLVACCGTCNSRKRDRTPKEAGMPLLHKAHKPAFIPFVNIQKHTSPSEWWKYLGLWNISIDERVE